MNFLSKAYSLITSPIQSILPNKNQLLNQAIDWNKDRLNDWVAQIMATAMILPVAFLVAKTLIRPCPVDWLLMKLIYELAIQTAIVAPMMSGYLPLKKKLSKQLLKIDWVEKTRQIHHWWGQPSDHPFLSMFGVISGYTLVYKYQEWIGLTLGGAIVHQALKISLYSIMLVYSNLLFDTLIQYLKERREEKECNEMLQRSWIMMADKSSSNEEQMVDEKEITNDNSSLKSEDQAEEVNDDNSYLTLDEVLKLAEETPNLQDSSIASDGEKVMLDFSLSESKFQSAKPSSESKKPKLQLTETSSKNGLSESIRNRIELFEKFQGQH